MVHINRVATSKEISEEKSQFEQIASTSTINLTPEDEVDDFTATVYGSKYASEDLPKHEMPVRLIHAPCPEKIRVLTGHRSERCLPRCMYHHAPHSGSGHATDDPLGPTG